MLPRNVTPQPETSRQKKEKKLQNFIFDSFSQKNKKEKRSQLAHKITRYAIYGTIGNINPFVLLQRETQGPPPPKEVVVTEARS